MLNIDRITNISVRLQLVREAINDILIGGQNYSLGRRALTRADLDKLLKLERQLEDEIDSEKNPQGRFRKVVPRDF